MVSESLGFRSVTDKIIYDTFHHPGRIALTWVNSATNKDTLLRHGLLALGILVLARND